MSKNFFWLDFLRPSISNWHWSAVQTFWWSSRWALQSGLGCTLLKRPELVAELIRATRDTVPRWRNEIQPLDTTVINGGKERNRPRRTKRPFSVSVKIRIAPPGARATGENTSNTTASKMILSVMHFRFLISRVLIPNEFSPRAEIILSNR